MLTMREQSAIPEPSVAARLDAIDRQILKELQDDGRITNVELARRVGISAPPCLRRVRALEQAGYIVIEKSFVGRKPLTQARITPEGRQAFRRYLLQMAKLVETGLGDG